MSVGVIGASLIALFYIPAMFMILKKYLELFNTLFRAVDILPFLIAKSLETKVPQLMQDPYHFW